MNLFLDVDSNKFVRSPFDYTPVTNLILTRGDVVPLNVGFVQEHALIAQPSGADITVGFKPSFTGQFVAYANQFNIENSSEYNGPIYSTFLSLANTGIEALFAQGTPVYLLGQVSCALSGVSEVTSSSLHATVQNDINTPSGNIPSNSYVYFPAASIGLSSFTLTGNATLNVSGGAPTEIYYVSVENGSPSFTGNICLQAASGVSQLVRANISFPTSGYQVVNVYDSTPSGAPLYWFSGDGSAFNYFIEATHTSNNWQLLNVCYIPAPNTSIRIS